MSKRQTRFRGDGTVKNERSFYRTNDKDKICVECRLLILSKSDAKDRGCSTCGGIIGWSELNDGCDRFDDEPWSGLKSKTKSV